MDSLQDILGQKRFQKPDEMNSIRDYIKRRWQADATVKVQHQTVILTVPSSALAASIQMEKHQLIKACDLGDKKLIIRTGK